MKGATMAQLVERVLGKDEVTGSNPVSSSINAGVVELADARDSKSRDGDIVWVRPPPPAPPKNVS